MPEIVLKNISKRYGRIKALEDVNLRVNDGEYLVIVGPSGCGKSTLLKIVSGILEPTTGEVYIDGEPVTHKPPEEREVGFIFQDLALFPHLTGYDNIVYGLIARGKEKNTALKEALKLSSEFKLKFRGLAYPQEMSSGEQQQVALLRALASGAKTFLLDEPLAAIDVKVAEDVRYRLREIIKGRGLTAMHVTHDQEEAMALADRIAVMRKGRIMQVGTPREVYYNPVNPFVMAFIGDSNFLTARVRDGEIILRGGYSLCKTEYPDGELLVVGVRPESVKLGEGIKGRIRFKSYLGGLFRFEVELETGEIITAVAESDVEGEDVKVWFSDYKIFKHPEGDIEEALTPG